MLFALEKLMPRPPLRWLPRAVVFAALLIAATPVPAQFAPQPPYPAPPPAPLMYVRFSGPRGAKITCYRGFDKGQTLELPVTIGFRPGYSYRLALFDVEGFPRHVFCPSLEVRGSLALAPKL